MRKYILTAAALFLAGCGALGTTSHDCLSRVAAAEVTITQSYETTTKLYLAGDIDKATAKKAVAIIDKANGFTDAAVKLCPIDQQTALQKLTSAFDLFAQFKLLLGQ